jgi:hypothetical protein
VFLDVRAMRRLGGLAIVSTLASLAAMAVPAPVAAAPSTPDVSVVAACPDPGPGEAQCLALEVVGGLAPNTANPNFGPSGYGPSDLQSAYNIPTGSEGTGMTVAVVDAYDGPNAEADLATYRSYYGLPACTTANGCFKKVNQQGVQGSYPAVSPDWGIEIDLDIQMVSAACPNCKILLVEADSNLMSDLGESVNTAVNLGAIAVTNSYGGKDSYSDSALDQAYFNHPGVAITASTGDCGWNCTGNYGGSTLPYVEYPASSQYVVAVGGTSLVPDGSARGWSEEAWGNATNGGAGSGCSAYEDKPSWQLDTGCDGRTQADVSAVADPSTGMAVVFNGTWHMLGGTSASSPIIAALFAMAGGPNSGEYAASYLYASSGSLYDVVGGSNDVTYSGCSVAYLCNAVAGYDGPTGLGTPNGLTAFTAPVPTPTTYTPIDPVRILDTRVPKGLSGKFVAGQPRTFNVAGQMGIPADATAVTGNVTVTNPTGAWALFVGPDPTTSPSSSTLNFVAHQTRSNGLTVALSTSGKLSATYMGPSGATTDLVFDVTGYFTPDTGGATYHAVTPTRLVDSRLGQGLSTKLVANTSRSFQVTGGVIPSSATAVTGNITVTNPSFGWAFYLGPVKADTPSTSNLNFLTGETSSNNVSVALATGGKLWVTYMSIAGSTADVVFDVTGYYTADLTGSVFVPINPSRLVDSRAHNGLSSKLGANAPAAFQVTGRGHVPAGATAVSGNLTVVNQSFPWALYVGPSSSSSPGASSLNFLIGDIKANGVVALLNSGKLYVTYLTNAGNYTDVVFDATGYYEPPPPA